MAAPITPFPINLNTIKYGQDVLSRWLDDTFTEGIVTLGDGAVTQNGGGNMSVNVAAGEAYVSFDTPYGGKRRTKWTATTSGTPGSPTTADNWTTTFTAAHATLPRVDRVVVTVQDANLDATGQRRQIFQVVPGTATSGADLTNLTGAAAVPANSMLLANVLVRAATTQILTADIDNNVRVLSSLGGRIGLTATRIVKTTSKEVINSTTETDLLNGEAVIQAGTMGTTGKLQCVILGDVLSNAAGTVTLRVKLGATTIFADSLAPGNNSANRRAMRITVEIQNLGVTNSQFAGGLFSIGGGTAPTTGLGDIAGIAFNNTGGWGDTTPFASSGTLSIDTTANQVLAVTAQWGAASASSAVRLQSAHIQIV